MADTLVKETHCVEEPVPGSPKLSRFGVLVIVTGVICALVLTTWNTSLNVSFITGRRPEFVIDPPYKGHTDINKQRKDKVADGDSQNVIDRSRELPPPVWNYPRDFAQAWGHVTASWNPGLGVGSNITHPDPRYRAWCWREKLTQSIMSRAYKTNIYPSKLPPHRRYVSASYDRVDR